MAFRRNNLYLSPLSPNTSLNRPFRSPERFIHAETTTHLRDNSFEFRKKPYLSSKSPNNYASRVRIPSLPSTAVGFEDKVGLYSEVERLTILNFELKKENDSLLEENAHLKYLSQKVPELEGIIHEQEKEIARKEGSLYHSRREHDFLTINNMNLRGLQPAYNDLVEHNRTLLSEVDRLNTTLKDLRHENELLSVKNETTKSSHQRLEEAERRAQILCEDLGTKNEEIEQYRARIGELNDMLDGVSNENSQLSKNLKNVTIEKDILQVKLKEYETNFDKIVEELREKMEVEKNTLVEYEKSNLVSRHKIEVRRKEDELVKMKKLIDELEERIIKAGCDNDHLQRRNVEKAEEVGNLELKISQMEFDREEMKRKLEKEYSAKLDKELKEQNKNQLKKEIEFETQIAQLKTEANEVERLRELTKRKEAEIEMIKNWSENNERTLEKRVQEALEAGIKSTTNQFLIEKSTLETEVSSSRDKITQLERQITLMTTEAERLNVLYSQKVQDINELQKKVANQDVNYRVSLDDEKFKLELEKKQALDDVKYSLETSYQEKIDEKDKELNRVQERVVRLMDENSKLTITAEERLKEIGIMERRLKLAEESNKEQIEEVIKRSEVSQQVAVEKELSAAQMEHNAEKTELEDKIIQLTLEIEKMAKETEVIEEENNELRGVMEEREIMYQEEKAHFIDLENRRAQEINEFREQFESYKKASIDMSTTQLRYEVEKASLNSQLIQYKEKVGEAEKRIEILIGENEKIKELYNNKINELEALRKNHSQLETKWYSEKSELENENQTLKRASLDFKESSIRASSEKSQYENQIKQLKVIKENGRQELEKLYELMNQRKKEYDHYIKQNDELKKEVDRLNRQLRDVSYGTIGKSDNIELERIIHERDMYKEQAENSNVKLQRTNDELREKLEELDRSRNKYNEVFSQLSSQLDSGIKNKLLMSSISNEGNFHAGES